MDRLTGRSINWRRTLRRMRRKLGLPRGRRAQALIGLGALAAVFVIWGLVDLSAARSDLLGARRDLSSAAGNLGTATDKEATSSLRAATQDAVARTNRAKRRLDRAPLLRALDIVPIVRNQRRGLLRAVEVARDAAQAGDALAARVDEVRDGLSVKQASVDLNAMATLADAAEETGRKLEQLPRTHRGGQWGPLASATRELDTVIADTGQRLTTAADTLRVARHLLGSDGPRRIFVALQNNAEMRDQGMVLSYAIAETTTGSFNVTKVGSVTDLELKSPVRGVNLPTGTAQAFSYLAPLQYWQSINATADTAITGRTIAAMYQAKTGQTIDGVVALDVPAIASLLSVTGPVSVSDIAQPITAENAESLLLDEQYASPAGNNPIEARIVRQTVLAKVASAVVERIRSGSFNTSGLVHALGKSAAGGHVWMTSQIAEDQAALERAGLSGRPGRIAPEHTIHVAVQNGTATKLDYFIDPTVDVEVHVTIAVPSSVT